MGAAIVLVKSTRKASVTTINIDFPAEAPQFNRTLVNLYPFY